jgi:hypothetical protein
MSQQININAFQHDAKSIESRARLRADMAAKMLAYSPAVHIAAAQYAASIFVSVDAMLSQGAPIPDVLDMILDFLLSFETCVVKLQNKTAVN